MAVQSLVPQRQALAMEFVTDIETFYPALEALRTAIEKYQGRATVFVDSDFTGGGLTHLDAQTMTDIVASMMTMSNYIRDSGIQINLVKAMR